MKLSKSHLDMISGSAPGELEVVLHPTKPLVIIGVVGTAVLMTMDPKQVEVLERRLAQVRGMLRDKALVEKSTPPHRGAVKGGKPWGFWRRGSASLLICICT